MTDLCPLYVVGPLQQHQLLCNQYAPCHIHLSSGRVCDCIAVGVHNTRLENTWFDVVLKSLGDLASDAPT